MAADHADTALEGFLELERRFQNFTRTIPVATEHLRVHSPVLASILLDACSLTETSLKSAMDNARYNNIPNIAQHRARRYAAAPPHLNINDLRTVFRSDMLYSKPVWYLPHGSASYPWYVWRRPNGHPAWWTAYNTVKHSRFEQARSATLGTTMHAMKALFLVLVQTLDFRERLVERGVIHRERRTIANLKADVAQWEVIQDGWNTPIVARSSLFGYRFLSQMNSTHAQDASEFL
ncbi:MAG: hypothetical protein KIT35_12410 [Piscinibacter sp.]|uniref:hypothetical protein n=1 Tax=Piscinibacter TaxID=1114981 RepID=UPI000FDF144A|nr:MULTISPECIES: hypothetical protein [Piscinibacter]MCW5664632.1 hypothetical protein [Piscinibacter sp.]